MNAASAPTTRSGFRRSTMPHLPARFAQPTGFGLRVEVNADQVLSSGVVIAGWGHCDEISVVQFVPHLPARQQGGHRRQVRRREQTAGGRADRTRRGEGGAHGG